MVTNVKKPNPHTGPAAKNHIASQFTRLKQRKATNLDSRRSIELFYSL